jgi:hypothetical protein
VELGEAAVGEVFLAQGAGQHAVAGARGDRRHDGVQVRHGERGAGGELLAEDGAPVAAHDGQVFRIWAVAVDWESPSSGAAAVSAPERQTARKVRSRFRSTCGT